MREPIATAPALTAGSVVMGAVAPSPAASTMFGITNVQIVAQSLNGGLPALQASDCPPTIVRAASRASSIGGGTFATLRKAGSGGGGRTSGTSSPVTSVKRNSSSSSFSSGGDRRSVFYTDPEQSSTVSAGGWKT
uniref:Uncharacterized protein n=1 Tax=Anopheles epiroticus TaxID=199890 RepID=A0A182P5W4_9DIPT